MKIYVENFYSVKHAEFEIAQGISVIAGRNGAGKSQLLTAIVSKFPNGGAMLNQAGFKSEPETVINIEPIPKAPLWRPAIRKVAEASIQQEFGTVGPVDYIRRDNHQGYVFRVDQRFINLHNRVCNMFVAGSLQQADEQERQNWIDLKDSFHRVFDKQIDGKMSSQGSKIGLVLGGGKLSDFGKFSTGELEFIALMCDLIVEKELDCIVIDELDAHFHPDLQQRVISEMQSFCDDKIVLISSQSPAVMLAVPPDNLFWIVHSSEVQAGANQISRVTSDTGLIDRLAEIYGGFSSDVRLINHYRQSASREIIEFAEECTFESEVVGAEKGGDWDMQVSAVRGIIRDLPVGASIVEFGAGTGRLLRAFRSIDGERVGSFKYVALDRDEERLKALQEHYGELPFQFAEFQTQNDTSGLQSSDLTILANVVHEIGPDNLAQVLNDLLSSANSGSHLLILEASELAVGESRFVLFDVEPLRSLFSRCIDSKFIELMVATPISKGGTPLIELNVRVNDPALARIDNDDVVRALRTLVEGTAPKFANATESGTRPSARSLAFHAHNIANATAFLSKLSGKVFQ